MKNLFCTILFALFFAGCSSGKVSMDQGDVRFAIPFDFPQPTQQEEAPKEGAVAGQAEQAGQQQPPAETGTQK